MALTRGVTPKIRDISTYSYSDQLLLDYVYGNGLVGASFRRQCRSFSMQSFFSLLSHSSTCYFDA